MPRSLTEDLSIIGRIGAVPAILQIILDTTGQRFAAVARVTDDDWIACAVLDRVDFGLQVGGELDVTSTLCKEVHASRTPIVIDKVSEDPRYCHHPTPRQYGFESYVSMPIVLGDGSFFGTLCALDPLPAALNQPKTLAMMESFARLLGVQLEAERQLQQTRTALADEQETAELREQFIALLGHDLRTPLFSISASAELLQRKSQDPLSLRAAGHIITASRRASRLVDDVLDFARGRLGNGIPLRISRSSSLERILQEVVNELRDRYPQRLIEAHIAPLGTVECDPDRLAQLLSNLLANALMHGADDHPVAVSALRQEDSLMLEVVNQGPPIPPQRLERLFQPYWRAASEPVSHGTGLGLGLYIVDQIASSHGGAVEASSSLEDGTRFSFRMPLSASPGTC